MPFLARQTSIEINYSVDGKITDDNQQTFLLFNGASLTTEFWGSLATRLAESGRVIRFDQRNAGKTRYQGSFTLNDVAADAAALLDLLEVEKAVIVGHAWGGRAAQVFVRDYPHRVSAMVICATGGQFPPVDTTTLDDAIREARKSDNRAAWEKAFEARWCGQGFAEREPARFAEIAALNWQARPNREARWDPTVSPSPSYWGRAILPSLLIYGEEDKNGTPKNGRDLHERIAGSELLLLPNAGHFLIREKEDEVLAAITRFTAGI